MFQIQGPRDESRYWIELKISIFGDKDFRVVNFQGLTFRPQVHRFWIEEAQLSKPLNCFPIAACYVYSRTRPEIVLIICRIADGPSKLVAGQVR